MSINMMCAQSPKTPPEEEKICFTGCKETRDSYLLLIKKRTLLTLLVQETLKIS